MKIIKRKLFEEIVKYIDLKEILVIHGARQVGKTTLMKFLIQHLIKEGVNEKQIVYLDLEDTKLLNLCNEGVDEVINYINARTAVADKKFIFIDEIQYLYNPSNFLKLFYDHFSDKYKIIVSGSSSFEIKSKFTNSLVGRIINFELYNLDFEEFLLFKNQYYNFVNTNSSLIHNEIRKWFKEFLIYGGYPRVALIENIEQKAIYIKELINLYIKKDIRDIGKIRNIDKFNNLIRILAEQSGQLINIDELSNTIGLARETIYEYLFILENTYVIRRISPFHTNIRSELSKMKKLYFEDTGILNYLRYGQFLERVDGQLLENGVFSILRKKIDLSKLKFWRTTDKKEIDFIIDVFPQSVLGYEVKLKYYGKRISAFTSFQRKYPNSELKVVSFEGNNDNKTVVYPWIL